MRSTLIAAGGDRVQDVRVLSEGKGLEKLLGSPFPSPDALLGFPGTFHDEDRWSERPADKKAWVAPESDALRGLDLTNRGLVSRGGDRGQTVATIDHDGTIIESHKRDTTRAYEGTRGYPPLVTSCAGWRPRRPTRRRPARCEPSSRSLTMEPIWMAVSPEAMHTRVRAGNP